jgi:uncharacterized protein YecT (DUF1311 family)
MLHIQRWLVASGVGFALSTLVAVARAQPLDCSSQDLTTIGLTDCAEQRLTRADSALNEAYAALMKRLRHLTRSCCATLRKPGSRSAIASSYRIGSGDQGGTLRPMLEMRCQSELTEARVKEFRKEIKCPSFDVSCTQD